MDARDPVIRAAAEAIRQADALLVGAGAGMGVDSGLPDFRGNQGFWKAYPPFEKLGLSFVDLANPRWFRDDPNQAWGFYGQRLQLYRDTTPHAGFGLLRRWAEWMTHGAFAFTSNVDGHFQRAGWDDGRVAEIHGSLHHLQCVAQCTDAIWPAGDTYLAIDVATYRARPPLPCCPHCGRLARPNVLMFGDGGWLGARTEAQEERYTAWLQAAASERLVLVECGAGTAIPSVRLTLEQLARRYGATHVRINPREASGPPGTLSIPLGALAGLAAIDAVL